MSIHPFADAMAKLQASAARPRHCRAAVEAAAEFERIESGQDGYEPWTPLYRLRVEEIIDTAIRLYGTHR